MKNLYVLFLVAILSACTQMKSSTEKADLKLSGVPAPQAELNKALMPKNPLGDYVGYWIFKKGDYQNILFVGDKWDSKKQAPVTSVYGIDLKPDFGYASVGTPATLWVSKDVPELQLNPDRKIVEALLNKEVNGEEVIFEMTFALPDANTLNVSLSDGDRSVQQTYQRVSDSRDAERAFERQYQLRAAPLIAEANKDNGLKYCAIQEILWESKRILSCIKQLVASEQLTKAHLHRALGTAIEALDSESVRYLLTLGVDVNEPAKDESESAVVKAMKRTSGYSDSALTIGQHGHVSINFEFAIIQKLLVEAGADLTAIASGKQTMFMSMLRSTSDAQLVHSMLDRGADVKAVDEDGGGSPLLYVLKSYSSRWGRDGAALIERMLKQGANPNEELRYGNNIVGTAAADGDVEVLKLLAANGAHVKGMGLLIAGNRLAELSKSQLDGSVKTVSGFLTVQQEISRVQKNLEYLNGL